MNFIEVTPIGLIEGGITPDSGSKIYLNADHIVSVKETEYLGLTCTEIKMSNDNYYMVGEDYISVVKSIKWGGSVSLTCSHI